MQSFENLAPFLRTPYFPVCMEGDGSVLDSKFGGVPWLSAAEAWPACKNCKKPMQLFVQLNLSRLPQDCSSFGKGLLQLFYCTNAKPQCEVECESWFWNDKAMLVRVIQPAGEALGIHVNPVENSFSPKTIVRWQAESAELPRVEELMDYITLSVDEADELYDAEANEEYSGPQGGDKLAGWPDWIQSVEYPECRICKKPMRLVMQLDSQVNIPYMWGDSGCGHITQCSVHPDVVSFGWACM